MPGPSASEVTTLRRYTNQFIIIITIYIYNIVISYHYVLGCPLGWIYAMVGQIGGDSVYRKKGGSQLNIFFNNYTVSFFLCFLHSRSKSNTNSKPT